MPATVTFYRGMAKFAPPVTSIPFYRLLPKFAQVIASSCKILSTSDKGFCFRYRVSFVRVKIRPPNCLLCFLGEGFFLSPTAKMPPHTVTRNMSKYAVLRKDERFGRQKIFNIYTKPTILGPILTVFGSFCPRRALTLHVLPACYLLSLSFYYKMPYAVSK